MRHLARVAGVSLLLLIVALGTGSCSDQTIAAPKALTPTQRDVLLSDAILERSSSGKANLYVALNVPFRHFVPDAEFDTLVQICTNQVGQVELPTGAQPEADLVVACELQYPPEHLRNQIHTVAQWRYQYTYLHNYFMPCLRKRGVSTTPLPKLSTFLARARSFTSPPPMNFVTSSQSAVQRRALTIACPPFAPGL